MKKKRILLLGLALLLLVLSGCKGAEKKEALPLREAVENALRDRDGLVAYTAEDLTDLTGIMPEDYTEALFLVGSDSLSGREIIAVRAVDAAALKRVVAAMENYLEQRREETRNYLPEVYQLQTQAKVEYKNLTAVLIVGGSAADETGSFLAGE